MQYLAQKKCERSRRKGGDRMSTFFITVGVATLTAYFFKLIDFIEEA